MSIRVASAETLVLAGLLLLAGFVVWDAGPALGLPESRWTRWITTLFPGLFSLQALAVVAVLMVAYWALQALGHTQLPFWFIAGLVILPHAVPVWATTSSSGTSSSTSRPSSSATAPCSETPPCCWRPWPASSRCTASSACAPSTAAWRSRASRRPTEAASSSSRASCSRACWPPGWPSLSPPSSPPRSSAATTTSSKPRPGP